MEQELVAQCNHVINTLYPKRNKVVHEVWGAATDPAKISVLPIKARGSVKVGPSGEFSADDIEAIAGEIEEAHYKLTKLGFEISAHIRTLPDWP